MLAHLIGLFALLSIIIFGQDGIAVAHQTSPADQESTKSMLDDLDKEFKETLGEWQKSGEGEVPVLSSPLVQSDALSTDLPPECLIHLEDERAKFEQGHYSKSAWLDHVFACEMCCAPLLADIIDIHVEHVIASPHLVILFDFDSYHIKEDYRQRLHTLMQEFDPAHDELLLIGRASRIGDRAYNIILSGKRAGEIQDYAIEQLGIDRDHIHYLFFGFDPPQLTPALATRYGITTEEIEAIDSGTTFTAEHKINQSVVVIINKGEAATDPVQDTPQSVSSEPPPQPLPPTVALTDDTPKPPTLDDATPVLSSPPLQTIATPQATPTEAVPETTTATALNVTPTTPPTPPATPTATESVVPPAAPKQPALPTSVSSDDPVANATRPTTALTLAANTSIDPDSRFSKEVAVFAGKAGFDVTLTQTATSLDMVKLLLTSKTPAMGLVPSDLKAYLKQVPNLDNDQPTAPRLLFPVTHKDIHVFARKGLRQLKDLDGKRLIIGLSGSENWITSRYLLSLFEVVPAEIVENVLPAEAIAAVLKGYADAMIYIAAKPADMFTRLSDFENYPHLAPLLQTVDFIPLATTAMASHGYLASTIEPDDYDWISTPVPTLAVKTLWAMSGFDSATVNCQRLAAFEDALRADMPRLRSHGHPDWQRIDLEQGVPSWKRATCLQSAQTDATQKTSPASKLQ